MVPRAFPLLLFSIIIGVASPEAHSQNFLKKYKEAPWFCKKELYTLLNKWGLSSKLPKKIHPSLGPVTVVDPITQGLFRLSWSPLSTPIIERTKNEVTIKIIWKDENCEVALDGFKQPRREGFSDQDLLALLKRSEQEKTTSLIYAWSPQMKLSTIGVKEARKISEEKGFQFLALVEPGISPDRLSKFAKKHQMDPIFLKRLGSQDLLGRYMHRHYPSILLVKNGVLQGFASPGYLGKGRMAKYLDEKLTE